MSGAAFDYTVAGTKREIAAPGKTSPSTSGRETNTSMSTEVTRTTPDIIREERKRDYYKDLRQQVEEKRQEAERERTRNSMAERTHNETMQYHIWGKPGSGAPNFHLDNVRRTKFNPTTGIRPQEQLRCKGFTGTPFHLHVK